MGITDLLNFSTGGGPAPAGIPERSNRMLWRPEDHIGPTGKTLAPHYESLFMKLHEPAAGKSLWLQFGARAPEGGAFAAHGHVMAVCFDHATPERHVALKQTYPPEKVRNASDKLDVIMGLCRLRSGRTSGRLEGAAAAGHKIAWDLEFAPAGDSVQHFRWPLLYSLPLPKAKATTPLVDTRFSGWFEVDGERITVKHAPGMQGHNWGTAHGHRWAWLHSNSLSGKRAESAGSYIEALSAQIKLGSRPTPWISTVHLSHGGERVRFDTLSRPRSVTSRPGDTDWSLVAENRNERLALRSWAPPSDFIGVEYLDPSGRTVYCRNSSIANVRIDLYRRGGGVWEHHDTLMGEHSAALELAGPTLPESGQVHLPLGP